MKETVLHLIKKTARNNISELELSGDQLTSLPPEIAELKNLLGRDFRFEREGYLKSAMR